MQSPDYGRGQEPRPTESWMRAERKPAEETAKTREAILDATEAIMREEGYAAVSSRRVAEKAGLKSQLVHYHFGSMDDLFVALYERNGRVFLERQLQALTSPNPLRALWELSIHPQRTAFALEMIALSNHRKTIRKQIAQSLEQMHSVQIAVITRYLTERGLDLADYPPVVLSYVIAGVSRALVTESAMGLTDRHAEVTAFAEQRLRELEGTRSAELAD
jgi:AcrR family transcriptional regulator